MKKSRVIDFVLGVPFVWFLGLFTRNRATERTRPKRILLIKLAAMGDTILLIPVLREFRNKHSEAEIHWMVSPVNEALAKNVPYVDKIIRWDRSIGLSLLKLILFLRSQKYDVVVDIEQWSRGSALISWLTGAKIRLGFDTPGQFRKNVFTQTYRKKYQEHEIDDFFGLLSLLGGLNKRKDLEIPIGGQGESELRDWRPQLKLDDKNIFKAIFHPGCGSDGTPREWPLANYAVLGHWLMKRYQAHLILTSGPEERVKSSRLNRLLNGKAVDVGGKISWEGLMALVNEVDLVVSGNTGIMHVAAALRKNQIALHGPTNSRLWGPLNPKAKIIETTCPRCPCLKLGFEYHSNDQSCMARIDSDQVKKAIESLIDNK